MNQNTSATRLPPPKRVYFFATCLVDLMSPQAGVDAIALIRGAGIEVDSAGADLLRPAGLHQRLVDEARAVARSQLDLFPQPWPIVVPSGSCAR